MYADHPACMNKPSSTLQPNSDPLGETLHHLRLVGTLYCQAELTAPWGIDIPQLDQLMIVPIVPDDRIVDAGKNAMSAGRHRPADVIKTIYSAMVRAAGS